jgi:2-phospho-L-lactate transferase/gluconeogenesis factor (CofD/UPF0052 family)
MKKTFKLTNDHCEGDEYYCVSPKLRYETQQFRLCVDKVNELFPFTKGKKKITVTLSTIKRKVKGEFEVTLAFGDYVPHVAFNNGDKVQILSETASAVKAALKVEEYDTIYATIS